MSVLSLSQDVYIAPNGQEVVAGIHISGEFIHILDKDLEDTCSLTNAVSDEFLRGIIDGYRESLSSRRYPFKKFESYRFLLYATDGMVSEWVDGTFKYCDDTSIMHEPYTAVMDERRKVGGRI